MNKLAIMISALAACGGGSKKGSAIGNSEEGKTGDTTSAACPLPAADDVRDRFAVGSVPVYRVEGMSHGAKCYDVFVPSDVIAKDGTAFRIVKEGVFEGHCSDEPDNRRKYQAYKPASTLIEVNALGSSEGELGFGKPITLDSKTPDQHAGVIAYPADSCGSKLSYAPNGPGETTWTAGPGCEKVAKVQPYDVGATPDPKSNQQQVVPLGPGTCTITATLLGANGDIVVTVK